MDLLVSHSFLKVEIHSLISVLNTFRTNLAKKFQCLYEGAAKQRSPTLLNEIYTELYIIEGESGEIVNEHEVRQTEILFRRTAAAEDTPIKRNDILKPLPEQDKPIRTVLTKGVAGIGKTLCLDECRLAPDFQTSARLTDVSESASVDVLLVNLIVGNLLPSALIWITSRPASSDLIPSEYVHRVTEIRGFNDPQNEEYFKKRISNQSLANTIIKHLKSTRSLHIMCHIPMFCWISATVLEKMLSQAESGEIPKTLTQMLNDRGVTDEGCFALASALRSYPSHPRELTLSRNKLGDFGVKQLAAALENPYCKLEILKLSDCTDLASALRSNPLHLRHLNLSGNKLGDSGVKLHSAKLESCKLEILTSLMCTPLKLKVCANGSVFGRLGRGAAGE
ncbi:NLR family CARD domain-containing protein 3 [Labeo rohita]|uniref:NLR family CARD domain-containing protein 3 n=1 Tax=Labeo rohita TaxID=84645 RepID=A0ABQ8LPX4_LABRO|nr:NLR family CARD domain-containing protein 3 [Labeo rohita]